MPDLTLTDDLEAFRAQFEKLSPQEKRAARNTVLIQLARGEGVPAVKAYAEYVHGWVLAPHHIEWLTWLMSGKSVCIVAPPESGKSRLVRTWQEWYIGKNRNSASILVQNTDKQARKQVMSVASVISKNPRFREVFPECRPTENWAKNEIYVTRDPDDPMFSRPEATLSAFGVTGSYQGMHIETLVIDDPTDQRDVSSENVMSVQRDHIKGVLIDRLKEGGNFFIILTRWSETDLVPTFEQLGVKILIYPAWKPADNPYPWDTEFTPETVVDDPSMEGFKLFLGKPVSLLYAAWQTYTQLKTKEQGKGSDSFKLTFLCMTEGAVKGERIFQQFKGNEGIRRYYKPFHLTPGERFVRKIIGIDWGTTVAHPAVLTLIGKTNLRKLVYLAAWEDHTGSSAKLADKAGEWKEKYKVYACRLDRSQWSIADTLKALGFEVEKGEHWVDARITAMRSVIDMNIIYFDSEGEGMYRMFSQMQTYRRDDVGNVVELGDDYVDSGLYGLCGIMSPAKSGVGQDVEIAPVAKKVGRHSVDFDEFDPSKEMPLARPGRTMAGWGDNL